jgi:hypothetical protein
LIEGSLYDGSSDKTPNKYFARIDETVSDSHASSADHRFSEVSANIEIDLK